MTQTFKFYDLKFYDTQLTVCYCDNSHNGWILNMERNKYVFYLITTCDGTSAVQWTVKL